MVTRNPTTATMATGTPDPPIDGDVEYHPRPYEVDLTPAAPSLALAVATGRRWFWDSLICGFRRSQYSSDLMFSPCAPQPSADHTGYRGPERRVLVGLSTGPHHASRPATSTCRVAAQEPSRGCTCSSRASTVVAGRRLVQLGNCWPTITRPSFKVGRLRIGPEGLEDLRSCA